MRKQFWIVIGAALSAAASSFVADETAAQSTPKTPPIPEAGPLAQPKPLDQIGLKAERLRQAIPRDNPQTPEKIALGEKLFFDGHLSADGTVACSTCHDPAHTFTDRRPRRWRQQPSTPSCRWQTTDWGSRCSRSSRLIEVFSVAVKE